MLSVVQQLLSEWALERSHVIAYLKYLSGARASESNISDWRARLAVSEMISITEAIISASDKSALRYAHVIHKLKYLLGEHIIISQPVSCA
jgi:hypothetical protein